MRLRAAYQVFILFLSITLLSACAINDKHQLNKILESSRNALNGVSNKPLSNQDIASGLKEALRVGTERVISQVGKNNGYLNDKAIHIALPSNLQKVHDTLNKVGLGKHTNELEVKMNHADRKSTRLNSSHLGNSYAVFCLKKKSIKDEKRGLYKKNLKIDVKQ